MRVGFVGAGNMASAMARGWAAGDGGPDAMLFTDAVSERAAELAAEVGGEAVQSSVSLGKACDLVVLAVKPKDLGEVAAAAGDAFPAVLSLLAATPLATVSEAFPDTPVLRIMPTLGVEVRHGAICLVEPEDVAVELIQSVRTLLGALGTVVPMDEAHIDAATAVMGSAPAFLALSAEALADAGARHGLDPDLSLQLVTEAMAATAELLRQRDPAALREAVASPGGATEAGLEALVAGEAETAFAAAVDASMERMRGGMR